MEVQKELKVQHLNLSAIKPDPNQPRKTFTELGLKLLSQSILEHGVQQPITVRLKGKEHIIVMGERRFRASKLAKKKTIPCIVREFDSKIISEIQIIENLQREDVEPIEEAESISYLLEKYTAEEISKRIGRTVQFVYGRIKLANLIEGFRVFVRNKEMTLSTAISIAIFPKEDQKIFLEGMGDNFNRYYINGALNDKMFDLKKAPFDLNDKKLIPAAGACTACPFNSANEGNLFGEDKTVCTKSSCFISKKSKSLILTIERAKKEKKLLVADFYKYNLDSEGCQLIFSIIKENGLIPYHSGDIDTIVEPKKPIMEEIKENAWDDTTEEDLRAELESELEDYNQELEEFNEAKNNNYKIGLLLDRNTYQTKEILMKLVDKTNSGSVNREVSVEKKKMADCTPKEKIIKIGKKAERKEEIESQREFAEIFKAVEQSTYKDLTSELSRDEMIAFCIGFYENTIHWSRRDKVKDFYPKTKVKATDKIVEIFKKNFKKEKFNQLIRVYLLQDLRFHERSHHDDLVNHSFYMALKKYCKTEIDAIEKLYAENRTIRENKTQVRIKELKD